MQGASSYRTPQPSSQRRRRLRPRRRRHPGLPRAAPRRAAPPCPARREMAPLQPRGALPKTAAWRPPACFFASVPPLAAAASLPGAGPPSLPPLGGMRPAVPAPRLLGGSTACGQSSPRLATVEWGSAWGGCLLPLLKNCLTARNAASLFLYLEAGIRMVTKRSNPFNELPQICLHFCPKSLKGRQHLVPPGYWL